MWTAYFTVFLGILAAQASPGPNFMAVASVALGQGRRHAVMVAAGVASGALIWAVAVVLGLAHFIERFPVSLLVLKFGGGGYLLFLGVKGILAARKGGGGGVRVRTGAMSYRQAWRRGLTVVLTNPKAVLMWAAVASFLFGAGLTDWQVLALGPVAALTALLIYGTYGVLFSSRVALGVYQKMTAPIEWAMGAAFGAMGGALHYARFCPPVFAEAFAQGLCFY